MKLNKINSLLFTVAFLALTISLSAQDLKCSQGNLTGLGDPAKAPTYEDAWDGFLSRITDENGAQIPSIENSGSVYISREVLIKILCDGLGTADQADGVLITYGMESTLQGTTIKRKMLPYVSSAKLNSGVPVPKKIYGTLPVGITLTHLKLQLDKK